MPLDRNVDDGYLDIRALAHEIWRGKWLALAIAAVVTLLALWQALRIKPTYSSVSKLVCKTNDEQGALGSADLASFVGLSLPGSPAANPSLYFEDILRDDEYLERILGRKWAQGGDSVFLEQIFSKGKSAKGGAEESEYVRRKRQVKALREGDHFTVSRNQKSGLISLKTTFPDPGLAHQINVYSVTFLNDYIVNDLKTQAKEKRIFVGDRIQEVKADLERSENHLMAFREKNYNTTTPKLTLELNRLMREVSVNQEIYLQLKKQYEIAKIDEYKDHPLIHLVSRSVVPIEKDRSKKRLVLALGILLGLALGFTTVLARYFLRSLRENAGKTAPA